MVVVLAVIAVFLLLDVLAYLFGCDSRDDERSDQHGRYAAWIEEAAGRRAGLATTVSMPARHVGSLLRGARDSAPLPGAPRRLRGASEGEGAVWQMWGSRLMRGPRPAAPFLGAPPPGHPERSEGPPTPVVHGRWSRPAAEAATWEVLRCAQDDQEAGGRRGRSFAELALARSEGLRMT